MSQPENASLSQFIAGSFTGLNLVQDLRARGYTQIAPGTRQFPTAVPGPTWSYELDGARTGPDTVRNTLRARRAPGDDWEQFSYVHVNGQTPTVP